MADRGALRVHAAGSLRPAFDLLAAREPGSLRLTYANARDLAERIAAGEEADVFASASPRHPRELRAAGLAGPPLAFATNRLVVAVPAASAVRDVGALAAPGARVVIEVEGIPLGDYTRELLALLDVREPGFAARVHANVVARAQTVDEVAELLLADAGGAAVLYASDVADRPGSLRAIELPPGAGVGATYVACAVTASSRGERAQAWLDGLIAPAAQAVLRAAGFGPPPR